jgi:hypothetical protein
MACLVNLSNGLGLPGSVSGRNSPMDLGEVSEESSGNANTNFKIPINKSPPVGNAELEQLYESAKKAYERINTALVGKEKASH